MRSGIVRELGLALIALALALRILIAPGTMVMADTRGLTVSLCTGQGAVTVTLPGKAPLPQAHDPCPYAALAAPPLLPTIDLLPVALPSLAAFALLLRPAAQHPHLGAPAPPPPATGPPATL